MKLLRALARGPLSQMARYFGPFASRPRTQRPKRDLAEPFPHADAGGGCALTQPGREILPLESSLQRFYRVMTSDAELSGVRILPVTSSSCVPIGIRQNSLIPTSSGRAARPCATNVALGMGIHYYLGASPWGAMKPPVSPNASWTVFRVQTSELLLRATLVISFPTFFLRYGPALLTAR